MTDTGLCDGLASGSVHVVKLAKKVAIHLVRARPVLAVLDVLARCGVKPGAMFDLPENRRSADLWYSRVKLEKLVMSRVGKNLEGMGNRVSPEPESARRQH